MPEVERQVTEQYPFIKNYIERLEKMLTGGDATVIHTIDELKAYIVDYYAWRKTDTFEKIIEEEECAKSRYDEWKKYLDDGYYVIIKTIDNDDDSTAEMLLSLNDGINFIVESEY
jgi:hypothetical protein